MWCLCPDGVICEVHPTAQIDVVAETVGQFLTQYFSVNGRRIPIIGQISINRIVKILCIPADTWGCEITFIENIQASTLTHGWGGANTSNKNWPVILGGPYSNVSVAWVSPTPAHNDYIPRSLDNPRAAALRAHDDFLCHRHCEHMRSPSTSRNHIVNPRVNRRGDDREGPVTQ